MLIKRKYNTKINESTSDDFVIDRDGVLLGYKGIGGDVIIPDGVSEIGYYVFKNCKNITSIKIPDSVKIIGDGAFEKCENLVTVTIPDGVESIGIDAFHGTKLVCITIPNSVKNINVGAFSGCEKLKKVTLSNSITSINSGVFYGCKNLKSINIPNSVTCIGDATFYGCKHLKKITIPTSVGRVGGEAFADCDMLTDVNMPNPIIIENNAFFGSPITKFNGANVSGEDDLHFVDARYGGLRCEGLELILPGDDYTHIDDMNGEECYLRLFTSYYNNFIIAVYSDMKREVFDIYFNSLTDGVRLVDILDIYDEYPVGVREDGKQTFLDKEYKGQWFDECYTDMKGNMYIDGEKVN